MEPGEEIEALVDELEQIVSDAKSPFGGGGQRKIVDAQDIFEILDEMRSVFPQEFADARRILREEGEMLDRAQKQADAIISDTVLAHLEENLRSLTGTVTRVRQTLNENSGVNNQSNNAVSW